MLYTIVVAYNGEKDIEKCLKSILASSQKSNIVVVDNGSRDKTASIVRNKFKSVVLIETGKNIGFGQGNNIGIELALKNGADFVFLLNQDACLENNCLSGLVNISRKYSGYGIISPIHLASENKLDVGFTSYISRNYNLLNDLYIRRIKDIYQVEAVNAAAWLMTKECLKEVGGFDPLFFHYGEDSDYCQRTIYKGLKIGVAPGNIIYHRRSSGSNGEKDKNNSAKRLRSELYYLKDLRRPLFGILADRILFIFYRIILKFIHPAKIITVWEDFKILFIIVFRLKKIYVSRKLSLQSSAFLFRKK